MWCCIEKISSFPEGFFDQLVLVVVELPYRLFQISYASMNKLGAFAARSAAEIVALNNSNL